MITRSWSRGKRFESARRLSQFGLDKLNTPTPCFGSAEDWHDALPDLLGRGFATLAMTHSVDARLFVDAVAGLDWGALVLGGERQGLCPRWESPAAWHR